MKALKIISCCDSKMWYAEHVGDIVPLLRIYSDGEFLSREPAGYSNIIRKGDAEIVDADPVEVKFLN